MQPLKLIWGVRGLIYKPFFGKIDMPSYIGKPCFIEGRRNIYIGKKVRIFPHIRMEALNDGSINIGDNVYIGQNCHITSSGSELTIGKGTDIMANVCITNIDHNYDDISRPILEQGYSTRTTQIGTNCFIGHGAVIQAGVILGNHVIVGANAVVCRNGGGYPDYCVIAGCPAKVIKIYSSEKNKWERYFN